MLPDREGFEGSRGTFGLNAPDGAGCFPTRWNKQTERLDDIVSMHLMVLGASRLSLTTSSLRRKTVSMHLMVLGASRQMSRECYRPQPSVSMHLMVLGASRHSKARKTRRRDSSLNAPDGAGCFPTIVEDLSSLIVCAVSMHLMVLGASRH